MNIAVGVRANNGKKIIWHIDTNSDDIVESIEIAKTLIKAEAEAVENQPVRAVLVCLKGNKK